MIKIGIIGAGKVCLRHVKALQQNEEVKIQAVADIIENRALELADQFGAIPYTDYKKMIAEEELDAVVINLPHILHKESAVLCTEKKLHTFVEKPMAVSGQDCEAMIKSAQRNHVQLMIGHIQRYFAENIMAKRLVHSGELGRLVMITDIRDIFYFSGDRPKWFFDKKASGGGILMNFGAHSLDKIKWLTDSSIKNITGTAKSFTPQFEIEGNAQVFVELENGITAVLSYCGYNDIPVNETTLYLTEGVIRLETGKGISVSKGGDFTKVDLSGVQDPFKLQMDEFMHSVKYGSKSPIPGDYGKEIVEAIEKVYCHKR